MYACHTCMVGLIRDLHGVYFSPATVLDGITMLLIQRLASEELASCEARRVQNVHSAGGRVT